jgi:hypothetical protein
MPKDVKRLIDKHDMEIRSAHAARSNIAFSKFRLCLISAREYQAELDAAERELADHTGNMIRAVLNNTKQ